MSPSHRAGSAPRTLRPPARPRSPELSERGRAPAGRVHLGMTLGLLLLAGWSCASDKPTGPPAAAEIKIMDSAFVPSFVYISPGQTVEWINRSREHRTVTSGLGPADPEAGRAFDIDLAGYKPGEPDGGHFRKTFAQTDTVHFFSRLAPSGLGSTISGTIIVR